MEPVLVEEKRAQAEKLIKDGYYADALTVLVDLIRDRSPQARQHSRWAKEQLPKVEAALKKSRVECQDACRLAEQLFDDFNYTAAVEILEKFKRGSRSAEAEELLKESKRALKKIARFNEAIDRAIYHKETDTDKFLDTLEALLDLDPKDRRAKDLLQKLEAKRHKESHLLWRLGLVLMCLLCLVAVGWVCKLVFWPEGQGTITIVLTQPDLTVFIDGVVLPREDFDKKLDRYETGEHKLELHRGLDVVAKHTFTISPNAHTTLKVPGEEVTLNVPARPLPVPPEILTDPLADPGPPLAKLDPEPQPMPEPEPIPEPTPVPPPEAPKINGFPIAKQTGYFHLEGPRVTPRFAVFTDDTTRVAAELLTSEPLDPDKTYNVFIWDTATGKTVQTLSTNSGELKGMAFSPDGKLIATAHVNSPEPNGGTLQIWNVESGALEQTLLLSVPPGQETADVKAVAFSADGKLVGLINQDSAYAWIVSDGKSRLRKSFAPASLTTLAFFPVGEILILGTTSQGNTSDGVLSWDMANNAQLGFLSASGSKNQSYPTFTVSPDYSVMTVLNGDSIRRYGIQNGNYLSGASLPSFLGQTTLLKNLKYSAGGKYVMASVPGRRPLVWRDSDFSRVAILGETSLVGSYAVVFSADSNSVHQLDSPDENDFAASAAVIRTWQFAE